MKLYTEEQVRKMLDGLLSFTEEDNQEEMIHYSMDEDIDRNMNSMTPIELPSEKEIAEKIASTIDASEYAKLVYAGALWMLDQIKQQGNGKDN